MDNSQLPPSPPRPPNFSYPQPSNRYAQQHVDTDPNVSPFTSSSNLQLISLMTATERSRNMRVAKTKPHLQFMVGPLLRYDTIENGVWRGAALIVSECAYSRIRFCFSSFILNHGVPYPDPHSLQKPRMPAHITTPHPRSDSITTMPFKHPSSAQVPISIEHPLEGPRQNSSLLAVTTACNIARVAVQPPARLFKIRLERSLKLAQVCGPWL